MTADIGLSVVIPVYFNEGSLRPLTTELMSNVFAEFPELTPEIVFVDDGSGDGSLAELQELQRAYPSIVRVIKLTRNFGQPAARLAGLRHARGELVVSMSADGQDPTELVARMIREREAKAADIVVCTRSGRDESRFRIWTSWVFFYAMRRLSFPNMPSGGFDYVLLTRRVLDVVLANQDASPFFQGQLLWTGFPVLFIPYQRRARISGTSRWTLGKKITLLIDAVLGYSFAPIRGISFLGGALAVLGFVAAGAQGVRYAMLGSDVPGWTTLVVLILLMGGMQMLMLGVIGEYVWRALAQSRSRDLYVVDQVFEETS